MSPQTLDPMKNLFSFYSRLKSLFFGVLIANTFFTITLSAQDEPSLSADLTAHFFSPQNVGLSSPQVADFTKYGNLNVNQFNGLLDMSIPLPGYKDRDFDLPMSIKYVSSGFIPSKRPSPVGLNWFLNFGGVVSRKVNGSPDDVKGCYTDSDEKKYIKDGLWAAIQTSKFDYYDQNALLTFNVSKNAYKHGTPYTIGDIKYDLEPDVFTFNAGKHSGSFIIDNQGKPKLLSGDSLYKIDLKGLTVQEYSTTEAPKNSVIRITAPDGYIYEFGGHISTLEYFIPNNPSGTDIRPRYITAWHLSCIYAPNQRNIAFGYDSFSQPHIYNYFTYYHCDDEIRNFCLHPDFRDGAPVVMKYGKSKRYYMKDDIHVPILRVVSIGGEPVIRFTTSDRTKFYNDNDVPTKCYDKVQYYWDGEEIKSVSFTYTDKNGYFFLESIDDSEHGKYTFQYDLSMGLPSPLTITTDHWGFWKGKNITQMSQAEIGSYTYRIEENNAVDTSYCRATLLNKVIYPAGGTSVIEYEPNIYHSYFYRDNASFNHLLTKTGPEGVYAGGARVKAITNYDNVADLTAYKRRSFEYSKPGEATGSGVLLLKPKYGISFRRYFTTSQWIDIGNDRAMVETTHNTSDLLICANSFGFNNPSDEYFICYPDVTEKVGTGGYNHYHYSSWLDIPDRNDITKTLHRYDEIISDYTLCEKARMYILNDMSRFRGKLLYKKTYSKWNHEINYINYKYNTLNACTDYNVSMTGTMFGNTTYKIYLKPCLLLEETSLDSTGFGTTKKYTYNELNQLASVLETGSNGTCHGQINQYVTDFPSAFLSKPFQMLKDKNMIDTPIKVIKTIRKDPNGRDLAIDAIERSYGIFGDLPLVATIKRLESNEPVPVTMSVLNTKLKVQESYLKYDQYGNPVHIKQKDGRDVVYVWINRGNYPLAQIQNATYDQVKAAMNGISPELYSASKDTGDRTIEDLYDSPFLKDAHITSYKYKYGVGITRITDPQRISTYYEYDKSNRLSSVYLREMGLNRIIESYEYHLPN
jgi:hypothetical protein